jgi:enamine deaminase RidA (YjgF/YER057c/UK114 family)
MSWGKAAVAEGKFVFLCGSEGIDPETNETVKGIEAQTELALSKMKLWLEEVGASLDSIVKMIIYVVDMDEYWKNAQSVFQSFLRENCPSFIEDPPPIDLIQVAGLARKDMLIEIAATALVTHSRAKLTKRESLQRLKCQKLAQRLSAEASSENCPRIARANRANSL